MMFEFQRVELLLPFCESRRNFDSTAYCLSNSFEGYVTHLYI